MSIQVLNVNTSKPESALR